MKNKEYKNLVKSMKLSNHWYLSDEGLLEEIRYGVFVPSNELIIELMEGDGFWLLSEVIKSCEYTKNVNLLYIITEFVIAKWKVVKKYSSYKSLDDDIKACLYASLKTIYRLYKEHVIFHDSNSQITRVLEDYKNNVDIAEHKPILDALLKRYLGYNIEGYEALDIFVEEEQARLDRIEEIKSNYESKYLRSYDISIEDSSKIDFLNTAIDEGMITIEGNGTIKSIFFEEENDFQVDPDIVFMLDTNIQACIIKESIDEGKINVIEGMDFLVAEKPPVKNL